MKKSKTLALNASNKSSVVLLSPKLKGKGKVSEIYIAALEANCYDLSVYPQRQPAPLESGSGLSWPGHRSLRTGPHKGDQALS